MNLFGKTAFKVWDPYCLCQRDYNLILCFCFEVCYCFLKPKWDVTFLILLSSLLVWGVWDVVLLGGFLVWYCRQLLCTVICGFCTRVFTYAKQTSYRNRICLWRHLSFKFFVRLCWGVLFWVCFFFLGGVCWLPIPLSLLIYDNYFKIKTSESFLKEIYFPLEGCSGNCPEGRLRIRKHLKIMCFKKETQSCWRVLLLSWCFQSPVYQVTRWNRMKVEALGQI